MKLMYIIKKYYFQIYKLQTKCNNPHSKHYYYSWVLKNSTIILGIYLSMFHPPKQLEKLKVSKQKGSFVMPMTHPNEPWNLHGYNTSIHKIKLNLWFSYHIFKMNEPILKIGLHKHIVRVSLNKPIRIVSFTMYICQLSTKI